MLKSEFLSILSDFCPKKIVGWELSSDIIYKLDKTAKFVNFAWRILVQYHIPYLSTWGLRYHPIEFRYHKSSNSVKAILKIGNSLARLGPRNVMSVGETVRSIFVHSHMSSLLPLNRFWRIWSSTLLCIHAMWLVSHISFLWLV